MSELVDPAMIERLVGAERHPIEHLIRVVDDDKRIYILHSADCKQHVKDLRQCPFSLAMDRGYNPGLLAVAQEQPVVGMVDSDGRLSFV